MGWFSVKVRLVVPVISGPSFTSVTVTTTSREEELNPLSRAWTVTRYSLLSRPDPKGDSKSGGLAKVRAPVSLIVKSLLSAPKVDHTMVSRSGSEALKV